MGKPDKMLQSSRQKPRTPAAGSAPETSPGNPAAGCPSWSFWVARGEEDGGVDFDCAARWGSFRPAAQELHETPAAVSQQIKQLEAALGFPLPAPGQDALNISDLIAPYDKGYRLLVNRRKHGMPKIERFRAWLIAEMNQMHSECEDFPGSRATRRDAGHPGFLG